MISLLSDTPAPIAPRSFTIGIGSRPDPAIRIIIVRCSTFPKDILTEDIVLDLTAEKLPSLWESAKRALAKALAELDRKFKAAGFPTLTAGELATIGDQFQDLNLP